MAKGGSGAKMLYFVLYIVLITELLIVITERDELEENEKAISAKMLGSIGEAYKRPMEFSVSPQTLDITLGGGQSNGTIFTFTITGLVGDEEKKGLKYFITGSGLPGEISTDNPGTPNDKFYLTQDENGVGRFNAKITSAGEFKFKAYFKVTRSLPGYLKGTTFYEELERMLTEAKAQLGEVTSATNEFSVRAIPQKKGDLGKKQIEVPI
jgi:hypothetical protein